MKLQYDPDADALYIELREGELHHGVDVPGVKGVSVDLDADGNPLGVEILMASERISSSDLSKVEVEDITSGRHWDLVLEGPLEAPGSRAGRLRETLC